MSSPLPSLTRPQVAALIASLHDRGVPALAVLYYHPVNLRRLGRFHDDPTPDLGASSIELVEIVCVIAIVRRRTGRVAHARNRSLPGLQEIVSATRNA